MACPPAAKRLRLWRASPSTCSSSSSSRASPAGPAGGPVPASAPRAACFEVQPCCCIAPQLLQALTPLHGSQPAPSSGSRGRSQRGSLRALLHGEAGEMGLPMMVRWGRSKLACRRVQMGGQGEALNGGALCTGCMCGAEVVRAAAAAECLAPAPVRVGGLLRGGGATWKEIAQWKEAGVMESRQVRSHAGSCRVGQQGALRRPGGPR